MPISIFVNTLLLNIASPFVFPNYSTYALDICLSFILESAMSIIPTRKRQVAQTSKYHFATQGRELYI